MHIAGRASIYMVDSIIRQHIVHKVLLVLALDRVKFYMMCKLHASVLDESLLISISGDQYIGLFTRELTVGAISMISFQDHSVEQTVRHKRIMIDNDADNCHPLPHTKSRAEKSNY